MGEARADIDRSRVEMMRAYAETRGCRRVFLLAYFGEPAAEGGSCGNCDTCLARHAEARRLEERAAEPGATPAEPGPGSPGPGSVPAARKVPFPAGCGVRHVAWGTGQVVRVEGDQITVLFDGAGYRTLSVTAVRERSLLDRT
ncbi:hypothetical protein FAIPA1_10025 [Frankia sp. AiPs1]|nr:RecQ family zinc-binding domain-containing protein [Frankia sp. AiPa1]